MTDRLLALVAVVLGVVLVALLIALGIDLQRSARTGPQWKRRLVAAGLLLLGSMGIPACSDGQAGDDPEIPGKTDQPDLTPAADATPDTDLLRVVEWQRLMRTWTEAEEIASGKRGPYPFDRAGKEKMLGVLNKVPVDIDLLRDANLITAAEAGLLDKELTVLIQGVQAKRPTELKMATCYVPMSMDHVDVSIDRLTERLPLLKQEARAERVQPAVLARVMATIEEDLKHLSTEEVQERMSPEDCALAKNLCAEAEAQLDVIRKHLKETVPALESTGRWSLIVEAWKTASPLANSGQSTTAQRESAKADLADARKAAIDLANAGLLSRPEADLLCAEAGRLESAIYRNPPTDSRIMCYQMAWIPPAEASLERLAKRWPLLEQLAKRNRVEPAVLRKVLPAIKADLATLASEEKLSELDPKQVAPARELRGRIEQALSSIEQQLGGK